MVTVHAPVTSLASLRAAFVSRSMIRPLHQASIRTLCESLDWDSAHAGVRPVRALQSPRDLWDRRELLNKSSVLELSTDIHRFFLKAVLTRLPGAH